MEPSDLFRDATSPSQAPEKRESIGSGEERMWLALLNPSLSGGVMLLQVMSIKQKNRIL